MKTVSAALAALLDSGTFTSGQDVMAESNAFARPDVFAGDGFAPATFVPFDLYTISSPLGFTLNYTTAGFPILAPSADIFDAPSVFSSGRVWTAPMSWTPFPIDVRGTRATPHWKIGLDSDRWQVSVVPRQGSPTGPAVASDAGVDVLEEGNVFAAPDLFSLADPNLGPDLIQGQPWLAAAATGVLDMADVIVARAYFARMPTYPLPPAGCIPVGTIILFRGTIGEIEITGGRATIEIDDYRLALKQMIPRNYYAGSCRHHFGDTRCTVPLSSYTTTGTAGSTSTRAVIVAGQAIPAPGGSATYTLGLLTMMSGKNVGQIRLVTDWSSGTRFSLLSPLPYAVEVGDTFKVSAGCDKRLATCEAFGNRPNFGGTPFVPLPETSLG